MNTETETPPLTIFGQHDEATIAHTLRPLGVAMAGRDIKDPYKD